MAIKKHSFPVCKSQDQLDRLAKRYNAFLRSQDHSNNGLDGNLVWEQHLALARKQLKDSERQGA